jgi:hypothetical protein
MDVAYLSAVSASLTTWITQRTRMRVQSTPATIVCAEKVMMLTIATFLSPNKTIMEHYELLKTGSEIDPLKEFSEAARAEMLDFSGR